MIARDEFEPLIPHSGAMCLIECIDAWDENTIRGLTNSHRDRSNPLRANEQLAAVHLIEYGAQMMAIHGALVAREKGRKLAPGFLAGVADVQFAVERLDTIESELHLLANALVHRGDSMLYEFVASAEDRELGSGRITVISRQPELSEVSR